MFGRGKQQKDRVGNLLRVRFNMLALLPAVGPGVSFISEV